MYVFQFRRKRPASVRYCIDNNMFQIKASLITDCCQTQKQLAMLLRPIPSPKPNPSTYLFFFFFIFCYLFFCFIFNSLICLTKLVNSRPLNAKVFNKLGKMFVINNNRTILQWKAKKKSVYPRKFSRWKARSGHVCCGTGKNKVEKKTEVEKKKFASKLWRIF